jgi:hypothetical protein
LAGTDHSLALRGGVISALLADSRIVAMVADRVYNEQPPAREQLTWPFIRVDIAEALPDETSCSIGEVTTFTVNFFSKTLDSVEARLGVKAIKRVLDGNTAIVLELEPEEDQDQPVPGIVELGATASNVIRDSDEPGAYHGFVDFSATTAEDA